MKTRRSVTHFGCSTLGALALASALSPQALGDDARERAATFQHRQPGDDRKDRAGELVRVVRQATERFRDVAVAEAEGYALHFGCVSGPDEGAMGLHYVNPALLMDGTLDATRPEIVIYEPSPNGRLRLIGADYLVLANDWDTAHPGDPPQLRGQLFHHFGSPNRFGLPAFYTLHVWAWKDNPSGMFTNWHATVSCDGFDGQGH